MTTALLATAFWMLSATPMPSVDTSRVMGSPDPLPPLEVERAFSKLRFERPLQVAHAGDGTDRLFVVEQGGRIYVFPNRPDVTEGQRKLFLDLSRVVSRADNEEGLMSIAFHPKYRENGIFFVYYTVRPLASVVARLRVSKDSPDRADPDSFVKILSFPQPYSNHNGGSMQFGPDGYLYLGLGDGGAANDPHRNGQNLKTLLGKMLRIDVDHEDPGLKYAIPKDNPFADRGRGVRGEIWAYGLRNVWRLSFDRLTGTLWVGDVGQNLWEEIDIIVRGGNYGWNLREGKHPFRPDLAKGDEKLIEPVLDYPRSEGKSVTGGGVYRGKRLPDLYGAYLYGDFVTGVVWALRYDGQKVTRNEVVARPRLPITSFGEDEASEMYLTAFDGYVHKFGPARTAITSAQPPFPRRLSETGLFTSIKDLAPAPGMIPYTVNVPLWSDHAAKERFIALPRAGEVEYLAKDQWRFPTGTVFVKTFFLDTAAATAERRRLETRLLVHNARGWEGYTYLWNDAQSDATLLDTALTKAYTVQTPQGPKLQQWYFPSRSDCQACHTAAAGHVLGLNTRQINRPDKGSGASTNQLQRLVEQGIFSATSLKQADTGREAYPDWDAPSADKTVLARAYLDVNCAICHTPGGATGTSLDLRFHTPLAKMGLLNEAPGKGRLGPADAKLLTPGARARSELYLRMNTRGPGQMPNLATSLPDQQALRVIAAWIESLEPTRAAPLTYCNPHGPLAVSHSTAASQKAE